MQGTLKPAAARVQQALREAGLDAAVVELPDSARTAEEAAAAVGTTVGSIVKSLVFSAAGEPVLALVSGANRLDTEKLSALAGAPVGRADAEAVRAATGFAIGGIPPLGHATPLRTWCDRGLLAHETVWAAAGTPHAVFAIAPAALVRASGAVVADLASGA
jgi:prolyl-tRNA editing enzyme YbaK/EbsC (Cys-tRNA(Pro) deacylase)